MRKIAFVGTAKGETDAPFNNEEYEIWAMNWNTPKYPRVTLDFEIHSHRNGQPVTPRKNDCPTISQENFPHAWVEKNLPRYLNNYFYGSTLDYMSAYALYQHKTAKEKEDKIELVSIHGVHMALNDDEYFKQQPSFHAWIGYLLAHFDVVIDDHSPLMKKSVVYGLGEQIDITGPFNRKSFQNLAAGHKEAIKLADQEIRRLELRKAEQRGSAQIWDLLDQVKRAEEAGQPLGSLEDLVKIQR